MTKWADDHQHWHTSRVLVDDDDLLVLALDGWKKPAAVSSAEDAAKRTLAAKQNATTDKKG